MIKIKNISSEAHQRHTIIFRESEIILTLRFQLTLSQWFFDVEYGGKNTYGVKLATGPLHIQGRNYPFDFAVSDLSGIGQDPFRIDDFTDRCVLYMLEPAEMNIIRGVEL